MDPSSGTGWASLRQQIRTLESQTETLFHTYSQFASSPNLPPQPSTEELSTESHIKSLLSERESLIAQLARLLDSLPPPSSSANPTTTSSTTLKQSALARHRTILSESRSTLSQLTSAIASARTRTHLLTSIRADISASQSAAANTDPHAAEADYFLAERGRLDNSHSVIDSVLSQASAISDSFATQRESLANINRRIVGAAAQIPGVNGLIQRIGAKRRRDGIVLGVFIGACMLGLLYFL